jgi:hypothetical protein
LREVRIRESLIIHTPVLGAGVCVEQTSLGHGFSPIHTDKG